jgi:hypothetical protein
MATNIKTMANGERARGLSTGSGPFADLVAALLTGLPTGRRGIGRRDAVDERSRMRSRELYQADSDRDRGCASRNSSAAWAKSRLSIASLRRSKRAE